MKNIFYICALLLSAFPLFGQATTGYHRVNQVIARSNSGTTALVVPFAKISVTDTATGVAAVIYFDPLLSSPIPSSLVTADLSGNYNYYMPLNTCNTESISAPGQSGIVIPNICGNPASTVTLETNGVNNGSQSLLNLVAGTGVVLTNVGGAVTINASGTSGVTSINSTSGAFTFTGSGVSCASTTCTFSGGGSTTTFSQTPSGTVNGVNVTFGLTVTPQLLILTDNGQVLTPGSAYTNSGMVVTFANPPPIGDNLYAQGITSSSLTVFAQAPSGTINGANTVFTFTVSPSLLFFTYNGQLLTPGVGYTLSGNTVTLTAAPQIGDTLYGQGVF